MNHRHRPRPVTSRTRPLLFHSPFALSLVAALLALGGVPSPASAATPPAQQKPKWQLRMGGPFDGFGASMFLLDDVDGDTWPEVIVGAPCRGLDRDGYARIVSSRAGRKRSELTGGADGDEFARAFGGALDINRDGVRDVAVGVPGASEEFKRAGALILCSSKSGRPIQRIDGSQPFGSFGASVCVPGDLDGDGVDDLVVGAPGEDSSTGAVYVFSGIDLKQLQRIAGRAEGDNFGATVHAVGDFNNDRHPDFAVAATLGDGRANNTGIVRVYSGKEFKPLRSTYGEESMALFGEIIAAPGDLDGDGQDDLLVSAPSARSRGNPDTGEVLLISGKSGGVIRRHVGLNPGEFFGRGLASGFDLDRDGVLDYAIGAPYSPAAVDPSEAESEDFHPDEAAAERELTGRVRVYSGKSGEQLLEFEGEKANARFGSSLVGFVAGTDRDSFLVIGAPGRQATLERQSRRSSIGSVACYKLEAPVAMAIEANPGGDVGDEADSPAGESE